MEIREDKWITVQNKKIIYQLLTVLIENRKHHINHMVRQIHMRHSLRHMLQRGLVNRSSGNMIESQRSVHIVDVVQKVKEIQVLLVRNAFAVLAKMFLHTLQLL